jgi:hypothetical protein
MGGSTNTSTNTTNSGPWQPTQGALKDILGEAGRLYDKNKGFKAYPGQTWTDFAPETEQALSSITGMAGQPNPFSGGATNFTKNLIGGGYNLDQSGFESLLGQNPNALATYGTDIASGNRSIGGGLNPKLQALMGQTGNAIGQNAGGIASGAEGLGTEGDYRSLFNQVDPEFEKVVQSTLGDVGDQIQSQWGGASFGSGGNTEALTRGLGDVSSRMRSDNYARNLAAKQGLLGDITGVQGANLSNRLNASTALSGEQSNALGQRAGLLGQMGQFGAQDIANQLGAAGALSGEQQTGFGNTRGLYGDMSNLSQQDIQNRMGGLGAMDSVYQSQYLPAQMLAGVGAAKEGKAAEELQARMDKFNIQQMAPWDRLAQYFGIATGTGQQGNRTTSTVSQPSNPLSSILGAGLLGSQIFAPRPV